MKTHLSEKVYLALPVFLQNIIVSVYGFFEHRRRYNGPCDSLFNTLLENEFKSREELNEIQQNALEKALKNAIENVPHYQKKGIRQASLASFPVLNREEIFDNPQEFVSSQYINKPLLKLFTGGSTGSPLAIYLTKEIRQKSYAFWKLFYKRMNFAIGQKKASLVGRKLQEPDNNKPPFWRYNYYDKQLMMSSYHLNANNIPQYIAKLNKFKPVVIEGYPLSILRIAEYIIEHNIQLHFQPSGLSTSSENFTELQRQTMEKAFGCPVYDQYGSAESVVFASECEHKCRHISMEYGVVEVLTKEGTINNEGEGELIVTSLINDVMPLIRYKIGDLGKITNDECPCGRKSPILEELYGKSGAVIVSENRTIPTAAIAIAFEYLEHVKKSQLVQNEPNRVVARLVTTPEFTKEEEEFMVWELKKMLGKNMAIDVERVDHIPPAHNGKYQMVVQNYYNNPNALDR